MRLRELPDVLYGRPRQCDAPGGVVAESEALFRLVPSGDFEYWCLRDTAKEKEGGRIIMRPVGQVVSPSCFSLSKRAGLFRGGGGVGFSG